MVDRALAETAECYRYIFQRSNSSLKRIIWPASAVIMVRFRRHSRRFSSFSSHPENIDNSRAETEGTHMGKILLFTADRTIIVLVTALVNWAHTMHTVESTYTSYADKDLAQYDQKGQVDIVIIYYPLDVVEVIRQAQANPHTKDARILVATGWPDRYSTLLEDQRIYITDKIGLTPVLREMLA